GGPSHIETFDPKPAAPREVRGEFDSIATAIPGVRFGEYLPHLARGLDRLSLVRSMMTTSPVHELAVHRLLGGVTEPPSGTGVAASVLDRPAEVGLARSRQRARLLGFVDRRRRELDRSAAARESDFDEFRRRAMDVLVSGECRRAFDLDREDPRRRDRYGRT